ncbi:GTP-binding protein [Catelliglobosispora koreensis]|uniref:GTP-binding protein n=1 Tax=Catelliglobosispora koreensis TaxID=129052 RepID=UPI00036A6649|nr:GTP-binding protein [Catelliglobosispora koreensis]
MERTLNLGILAHVDAGKTSLTERLLFNAGVIREIGSVDAGNTQTDSLALERQRGITIKAAVATFHIKDTTVNLIDTPGHPDFIAEVERVLTVLDGAVLVISAVEGVQAQTRILMRTLKRLNIPTLIFINKIDRAGADVSGTLKAIKERLTPDVATTQNQEELLNVLSYHDDQLTKNYLSGQPLDISQSLATLTKQARIHPVYTGSAITGEGITELEEAIATLLPAEAGDPGAPAQGTVFKVERGQNGEKIAYVRMFAGTIRVRDRLGDFGKVTRMSPDGLSAGQIGKLWGLSGIRIGDSIGMPKAQQRHHFAPPTLETVIQASDSNALHTAMTQLAEQDPLINLRQDGDQLSVSLYGEVQKEVIQATLACDFGVDVTFRETTTICQEHLVGTGEALELIYKDPNPFLATVGLRVEPSKKHHGIHVKLDVPVEHMPLFLFRTTDEFRLALEETVRETLAQGLYGWQVSDCLVTLTHSGYQSPGTTPGDYRKLVPLVLMAALRQAGTTVGEPVHHFRLDGPSDLLGPALRALAQLNAVPQTPVLTKTTYVVEGEISAGLIHQLQQRVPGLTRGEGVLESQFSRYRKVHGTPPVRARTDHNPLNRKEYLMHLSRRS